MGGYQWLLILVGLQRLLEVFLSRRHEKWLRERGAREFGAGHFQWMVLVHVLWWSSCLVFSFFQSPLRLSTPFLILFLAGQTLRLMAMATLGRRWTVRIMVLPDAPAIRSGIYRFIRHPNYWGVVLEIFALPMVGGLWALAIGFSVANALVLSVRVQEEEKALNQLRVMAS